MKKNDLRNLYLEKRKKLSVEKIEKLSIDICNQIFEHFDLNGSTLSLYLPIKSKNEINTFHIWEKAARLESIISVPKSNFKTHELTHIQLISKDQLIINQYDIPEPVYGNEIKIKELKFIFIPLIAIDHNGNRVGYGKGFYDRFLSKCNKDCLFIGLNLFENIDVIDDINNYDIALDYCVTPTQVLKFPIIHHNK
jgi:5-formyltetrahydrofolate cyclo-ligase